MKNILTSLWCCLFVVFAYCQSKDSSVKQITITPEMEKYWTTWINDLYDIGIQVTHDSIKMNEEAKKIVRDTDYQKMIYPKYYTWEAAAYLLKNMQLKKACWYLINLYASDSTNKLLVVRSLVPYDQIVEMDKVLTSTFYTYAMLDPNVSRFTNGRYQVLRPDVLENKFKTVKEIISYVRYFREIRKEVKTNP
jgi:hypothetical protein